MPFSFSSTPFAQFNLPSGAIYQADANGNVMVHDSDLVAMLDAGCHPSNTTNIAVDHGGNIVISSPANLELYAKGKIVMDSPVTSEHDLAIQAGGNLHVTAGGSVVVDSAMTVNQPTVFNAPITTTKAYGASASYPLTTGQAGWHQLGTYYTGETGDHLRLALNVSAGFNASAYSNCEAVLMFKTSNTATDQNGYGGDAMFYRFGPSANSVLGFKIVASAAGTAATSFTVFVNIAGASGVASLYQVLTGVGVWVDQQQSDPPANDPGDPSSTLCVATELFVVQSPTVLPSIVAMTSYPDDASAAAGGVVLGQLYRNGNAVKIRVV